jgi:flagellar biosynthesis GTPase FlhF
MFKEFGVRLHFTPTILGTDLINLKVRPEVSSLDFSNAITLNGFRVPALSSRRTETEVELQDGQTFAIAGLMNNTLNSTMDKIPGIGDIPVLGYLFRSRAYQKNQTELVVMITPQILRRGSNGVSSGLPAAVEPFLGAPRRTVPQPAPYVGSPVYPVRPGGAPSGRTESEPPAPVPVPAVVPTPAPAVPVPAPVQPAMEAAPAAAPAIPASTAGVPASTPEASVTTPAPAADVPAAEVKTQPAPKPDRKAAGREREAQKQAAAAQKAADKKAAQEKAAADKKAAEEKAAADKKAAAEQVVADRKAAIAQARQQKLDEERAKRDAEVAKKTAEEDRKKAEEQQKHDKLLLDAAARLKAAQAAYQAELDKKKGLQ